MKKKIIVISVIVVIIAISVYFLIKNNYQQKTDIVPTLTEISPTPTDSSDDTNPTTTTSLGYACQEGKTVFESLLANKNKVEYKENPNGIIVTSIDGVAETETLKWQFKLNGKYAEFPSNVYTCKGDERIIWELNQI